MAVVATAEVQEQIAFGPVVAPGLVGHGAEDERPEPLGGLALANVDDPAIVHFDTAGPKGILRSVEAAAHGEGKVGSGKQQAAIVLPQPLTLGTQIEVVPIGPEVMRERQPATDPVKPVELMKDRVGGYDLEVCPILGYCLWVIQRRALVVRCVSGCLTQGQPAARQLQQTQRAIAAAGEKALECAEAATRTLPERSLDSAPDEEELARSLGDQRNCATQ